MKVFRDNTAKDAKGQVVGSHPRQIKSKKWQINKMFFHCVASHSPGLLRRCSLSMFDTTKAERKGKSETERDKQPKNQRGKTETQRNPVSETDNKY